MIKYPDSVMKENHANGAKNVSMVKPNGKKKTCVTFLCTAKRWKVGHALLHTEQELCKNTGGARVGEEIGTSKFAK